MKEPPRASPWHVVSASVRGTGHVRHQQPCQDRLAWETSAEGRLLVAMADGAGSASLAEAGAEVAVTSALAALRDLQSSLHPQAADDALAQALREVLARARSAVLAEADHRGVCPRELAATLSAACFAPGIALAAQVGDGAVVAGDAADGLLALTRPIVSDYLNETTFLISDDALSAAQISVQRRHWRYAVLFSDGLNLLALKMPEAKPHAGFFRPLFRFLDQAHDPSATPHLESFLQSPRVTDRTDDDLTLFLAASGASNPGTHAEEATAASPQ